MQIYNTIERALVPLEPSVEGRVSIYVCGPTVQSEPHLGHGRSAVSFDVLRRYLEWLGNEVVFVRNVTDIDDKIIAMAENLGSSTEEVARDAFGSFSAAYDRLGNLPPTIEPKATEHIPGMVTLISELIETGHAYESGGDVYFSVRSFDGYGRLSRHSIDDLRAGERVEPGDLKRDPLDFAMWKAAKPGEPRWDSPWGPGRPGWHIECSAMATQYLGPAFDIHAGGSDLIFPHHENEIAQSEAPHGDVFAKYWMHNGMLNLRGEKMAKSTGHVVTLLDSLDRWDPVAVRLFYLRTHYRKPLDFSPEALDDAEASLGRLHAFRRRAPEFVEDAPDTEVLDRFKGLMDNDLDVAGALAVVFDVVRNANAMIDAGDDAGPYVAAFDEMMTVLGLTDSEAEAEIDIAAIVDRLGVEATSIDALVAMRDQARHDRDWGQADAIRDELASVGVVIEDTPDGARGIGTDLEGIHAVEAALDAGRVTSLVVEQRRSERGDVARIVARAEAGNIPVRYVDDVRPMASTHAPQGVVASARPLSTLSIKDAVSLATTPAFLVVDHVEDPRNIGAAARSAHAAGMTALIVSDRRSAPLGATAFKAAVGALEHLPVVVVSSIPEALKRLGKLGVWTVGLDGEAETSLLGLDLLDRSVALCIGAEGAGLSRLVAERCDVLATIPMVGDVESLNASVASALACFEVARVRGWVS